MAKFLSTLVPLLPFFIFIVFCSIPYPSESLKLNLIPPNSPKSPFYLGNLTLSQKIQKLAKHSRARAQIFAKSNSTSQNDQTGRPEPMLRVLPEDGYGPIYAVEIGLGTFGVEGISMFYSLLMDTASSLTWVQCQECRAHYQQCFPQKDPLYPNLGSLSYDPLRWSRDGDLCDPSDVQGDLCYYNVTYGDGSTSYGQLGYETMIFPSVAGRSSIEAGLVLGCGLRQVGFPYGKKNPSKIAGVLGLGQGPHALQKQLAPRGGHNTEMFSYCLRGIFDDSGDDDDDLASSLHFGGDIIAIPNSSFVETPLIPVQGRQYYSLNVTGITVNGDTLRIPPSIFQINGSDGHGGTILDSGTPFSHLTPWAYFELEAHLKSLFDANSNYEWKPDDDFRLCYRMKKPEGYSKLPTISFVVDGGILKIPPEQAFYVDEVTVTMPDKKYVFQNFCLVMLPNYSSQVTVIGAYQQVNHRFIYDTQLLKLWFKPADCVNEP